jgi:hypothetical protein
LIKGESVTTVVCDRAVNDKKMKAIKRVLPAIDLGVHKNFFSEKTMVIVTIYNYKIMPALIMFLQVSGKYRLKEQIMTGVY